MLAVDITGVVSLHDDFRFLAGSGIPDVWNTYEAEITGDIPTKVEFVLGGKTLPDTNAADGWTAIQYVISHVGDRTHGSSVRGYDRCGHVHS